MLIINLSLCVYALHRMLSSFSWTIIIRINILSRHVHQWPVSKTPPDKSQKALTLGLLLNSDHSDVVLDTGPPADSAEVSDRYCFPFLSQTSQSEKPLGFSFIKFLWIIPSHSVLHYKPTRVTNKIMLFFFFPRRYLFDHFGVRSLSCADLKMDQSWRRCYGRATV